MSTAMRRPPAQAARVVLCAVILAAQLRQTFAQLYSSCGGSIVNGNCYDSSAPEYSTQSQSGYTCYVNPDCNNWCQGFGGRICTFQGSQGQICGSDQAYGIFSSQAPPTVNGWMAQYRCTACPNAAGSNQYYLSTQNNPCGLGSCTDLENSLCSVRPAAAPQPLVAAFGAAAGRGGPAAGSLTAATDRLSLPRMRRPPRRMASI